MLQQNQFNTRGMISSILRRFTISLKSSGSFVCQDASNWARLLVGHFIRNNVQLLGNPNSSSANRTTAVSEDDSQQQSKNEDEGGSREEKLNRTLEFADASTKS